MLRNALIAVALLAAVSPAAAQPSTRPSEDRGNSRALTAAESYLAVPTLSTGVLNRFRTAGTLVVDVGLDIPNAQLRARARSLSPRLRDALRTALSTYASTYYRADTAPDPAAMARLMQQAVNRTLGGEGARLLLSNVVYQRRG
ncbi:MAG: hypothetical protein AB7J28_11075 [Hyphomonadaceae bacterium]